MELNLCPEVVKDLKRLGNPALVSEPIFLTLLEKGGDALTKQEKVCGISDTSKGDIVKGAYTGVVSLFVEASRSDSSPDKLNRFLEDLNWPASRSKRLTQLYTSKLPAFQAALTCVGRHPPHIVDVHWELKHCIKSSSNEHMSNPLISIQFLTEGSGNDHAPSSDPVTFACTVSELQDLLAKLKEALRHVHHIGQLDS